MSENFKGKSLGRFHLNIVEFKLGGWAKKNKKGGAKFHLNIVEFKHLSVYDLILEISKVSSEHSGI